MDALPKTHRSSRRGSAAVALLILLATVALHAHHSAPLNYDLSRQITVEGTLTEITWRNPHARFRIDVVDSERAGAHVEWLAEMPGVNNLKRAGFPMVRFHVGDRISVTGRPGRRDRAILLLQTTLSDGTRLSPDMRAVTN